MISCCPTYIVSFVIEGFRARKVGISVPNRAAIEARVSPTWTVYIKNCDDIVGEAVKLGELGKVGVGVEATDVGAV